MDFPKEQKIYKAKKKLLPALGGKRKNYIRKAKCLKTAIIHLINALEKVHNKIIIPSKEKDILNEIKKDFVKLSKYEIHKNIDFYFICSQIIQKYDI